MVSVTYETAKRVESADSVIRPRPEANRRRASFLVIVVLEALVEAGRARTSSVRPLAITGSPSWQIRRAEWRVAPVSLRELCGMVAGCTAYKPVVRATFVMRFLKRRRRPRMVVGGGEGGRTAAKGGRIDRDGPRGFLTPDIFVFTPLRSPCCHHFCVFRGSGKKISRNF